MYFLKLIIPILLIRCGLSKEEGFFILGNNHCITNRSSAIVFNQWPNRTSHYDSPRSSFYPPTSDPYHFACDFDGDCRNSWTSNTKWNSITSLDSPVNEYVTDRRWEDLLLTITVPANGNKSELDFYPMDFSIRNGSSFTIPLSVRGKQDGNIFLCDDETQPPSASNCYWIMLAAFDGERSAIRKCKRYQIPHENNVWTGLNLCKTFRVVNKTIGALDENIWRHFKIMKHGFTLKVLRGNEDFLEFHDNETNTINPQKIWLHSKVNVLWKVHQYKYLYSDSEGNDQLGPSFQLQQNTLCISMFMALCDTCSLTLIIKINKKKTLLKETFNTTNGVWREIKVIYDISKGTGGELSMFPIRIQNSPDTDRGMWALDDVRLCKKDEFRYVKSGKTNTPCQTIAIQEETLLDTDGNDEIKTHGIKCPENSFGKRCIPCAIFGMDYCSNFEYCEYIDGQKECHCTPGYEDSCSTECKLGTYGHGCQEKCSPYCSDTSCRHIDGYCKKDCKYSFTGKKCEKPPEPFFVHQPIVSDITFSSTQVKMENFEVVGYDDRYPSYVFQYIEDPNQFSNEEQSSSKNDQNSWIRVGDKLTINETKFVLLTNLKPDTYYRVRAVMNINRIGRKFKEDEDFVKSTRWKTTCNGE
ncbi:unnamed protein product [Phaedon cochleariae]|uniref:Uncharacterized protein n=1 Tax=Phaedon cochleariae TaxID=80249 RepID=A0A9N9SGF2_PHACE|nr:unnamed protein product [Phaedon cochleariae]